MPVPGPSFEGPTGEFRLSLTLLAELLLRRLAAAMGGGPDLPPYGPGDMLRPGCALGPGDMLRPGCPPLGPGDMDLGAGLKPGLIGLRAPAGLIGLPAGLMGLPIGLIDRPDGLIGR